MSRSVESRGGVDRPVYEPRPAGPTSELPHPSSTPRQASRHSISPVAVGVTLLGAVAVVVACFVPLDASSTLSRVQDNSLIQRGAIGWALLIIAAVVALCALGTYFSRRRGTIWAVTVLGVVLAMIVGGIPSKKLSRPPAGGGANAAVETREEEEEGNDVSFGIPVYLAGAGSGLVILGSLVMRATARLRSTAPEGITEHQLHDLDGLDG